MNNKTLGALAFLGVFLIIGGNLLFQNKEWIDTYWTASDVYDGVLLLIFGFKAFKA